MRPVGDATAPPRFSIVIPTFQRRDVVVASVRALDRQEGAEPFEAIVVVYLTGSLTRRRNAEAKLA